MKKKLARANIALHNICCTYCKEKILKGLSQIKNISNIYVNVPDAFVMFTFIKANDLSTVENCLTSLGYPPIGDKIDDIFKTTCFCKLEIDNRCYT
ncbi:hypothetical protein [Aquimarina sp. AU474]|uniref:hypothetical protein n=1 Tax=Aquimarina sp. AU474 TaxID=2108529 RepID=UPI000D68B75F|nr:hypothetical protein [Aquimarina sp. AU474]